MKFEQAYNQLLPFAKRYAKEYGAELEAEEIISEAFIAVTQSSNSITFETLKKHISLVAKNSAKNHLNSIAATENLLKDQNKFCRCCKEDKPISCFGVTVRRSTGAKIIQTFCHECIRLKMANRKKLESTKRYQKTEAYKRYLKKYRNTPEYKKSNRERQRRHREKLRALKIAA